MFKSLRRITYQAADLEKAKDWYISILETTPVYETPFLVIFRVGECSLTLAKPQPSNAPAGAVNSDVFWEVDDIDEAYAALLERGALAHTPVTQLLNVRIAKVIDPLGNILGLTGTALKTEKRNIEKTPSETAMTVAFCRALSYRDDRVEIQGQDNLAELFLTDEAKKAIYDENSRRWAREKLVTPPLYGYFIARTAWFDEEFLAACDDGTEQIVLLGAGYDTRAFRFADRAKGIRVYEIDIFTTQERKIEALKRSGVPLPMNISFVTVNFKTDNIQEVLFKAGFDSNKKTLFIWEGVTYYLTREAIENTIRFIAKNSGYGSALCFDFMTEKSESLNPAEPFLFWSTQDNISKVLAKQGMHLVETLDPAEMTKRYLTLKDGTSEQVLSKFRLAKASGTDEGA